MFNLILVGVISSFACSAHASIKNDLMDIRRMIVTSMMRQQGRNIFGTDKQFPNIRPVTSSDLEKLSKTN